MTDMTDYEKAKAKREELGAEGFQNYLEELADTESKAIDKLKALKAEAYETLEKSNDSEKNEEWIDEKFFEASLDADILRCADGSSLHRTALSFRDSFVRRLKDVFVHKVVRENESAGDRAEEHFKTISSMSIQVTEAMYAAQLREEHLKKFPSIPFFIDEQHHDVSTIDALLKLVFERSVQATRMERDIANNPSELRQVALMKNTVERQLHDRYCEFFGAW